MNTQANEYTKQELEAAKKAISSTIQKLEKVYETLLKKDPAPKPQLTLAIRNLAAQRVALSLIERELAGGQQQE